MRTGSRIAAVLVAGLLLLGIVGTALAAKAPTNVTITKAEFEGRSGVRVKGKVTSSKLLCQIGRKVSVYHDVPPPGPSRNDFKLGTTKTNGKGEWKLESEFEPDKVYAKVKRTRKCKKAVSDTVRVK